METTTPTVTVSVAMKVNLGNYEAADADEGVSGLEAGATEEQINELLDTGRLAWGLLTKRLGDKVADLRKGNPSTTPARRF